MHSLKKLKKIKKNSSELDLFLITGMEVFSTLHEKKKENNQKNNDSSKKEGGIELETEKKIDALLAEYEKDKKSTVKDPASKKEFETKDSIKKIQEISYNDGNNKLKSSDINYDDINQVESLLGQETEETINEYKQKDEKNGGFFNKKLKKSDKKSHESGLKIPRVRFRRKTNRKKIRDDVNQKKNIKHEDATDSEKIKTESEEYNNKIKNESKEDLTFKDKKLDLNSNYVKNNKEQKISKNLNHDSKFIEKIKNKNFNVNKQNEINDSTPQIDNFLESDKDSDDENLLLDCDIKRVLEITDNLLGKLPENVIDEFVKSKDFELYEKIINKFKNKG